MFFRKESKWIVVGCVHSRSRFDHVTFRWMIGTDRDRRFEGEGKESDEERNIKRKEREKCEIRDRNRKQNKVVVGAMVKAKADLRPWE